MSEDLSVFFADDLVTSKVTKGVTILRGQYDAPGSLIGDQMVVSDEHSVLMKSSDVTGWKKGDALKVDIENDGTDTDFYIRTVVPEGDGKLSRVTLSKKP